MTLSRHISSYTLCYKDPSTNLISEQIALENREREEGVFIVLLPIKRGEQHTRRDTQYTTRTTVTLSRHISSYTLCYKDPSTNLISEQIALENREERKVHLLHYYL